MPGVFKRNAMRNEFVTQTQYQKIGKLKSMRNTQIMEYTRNLNDRKSFLSNFKNNKI